MRRDSVEDLATVNFFEKRVPITESVETVVGPVRGPYDTLWQKREHTVGHRIEVVAHDGWNSRRRIDTFMVWLGALVSVFSLIYLGLDMLGMAQSLPATTALTWYDNPIALPFAVQFKTNVIFLPLFVSSVVLGLTYWRELAALFPEDQQQDQMRYAGRAIPFIALFLGLIGGFAGVASTGDGGGLALAVSMAVPTLVIILVFSLNSYVNNCTSVSETCCGVIICVLAHCLGVSTIIGAAYGFIFTVSFLAIAVPLFAIVVACGRRTLTREEPEESRSADSESKLPHHFERGGACPHCAAGCHIQQGLTLTACSECQS